MGAIPLTLAVVVLIASRRATNAVGRELRAHLEREGWGSLDPIWSPLRGAGFRGNWQGRETVAMYYERNKSFAPRLEITVSTQKPDRIRIARAYPPRLAFLDFEFGMPPKVESADRRFQARADSQESIESILRDEATASKLATFLTARSDVVEMEHGKLQVKRSIRDAWKPGFSITVRPPAEEVKRTVELAHRLLESFAALGF
ncbi:MAG: hypothetical protein WC538_08775 [Thermoanaerobaculia bacterium]